MSFDDLIGADGLSAEEEARLRRVHELLVEAGPPAELPPELRDPASLRHEDPPEVPLLLRRRRGLTAVLALAAAIAAFAGGYAFGHSKSSPVAFTAERTIPMHGAAGVHGVLQLAAADKVGNWPMLVEVSGLPQQPSRRAYYELWLTRNGKPIVSCGQFRVHGKTTRVQLNVPYSLHRFDGWVVTVQPPHEHAPGRVVLST
jgi:hypothetical protein